ncbi:MAG: shikimate dehydrogenase family protein [Aliihoeflea sp.]
MNQGIVTAATRVVFMIGTPIAQVRSPTLFNRYFAERRIDRIMVPLEVSVDTLDGFVAMVRGAENCDGFVATLPHKRALLTMVDEAGPTARALESVNAVRRNPDGRLFGDMADGAGFWNGARAAGFEPFGKSAVLAGAGAAGTAIAFEFAQRGGRRLAIWSRSDDEVGALARRLAGTGIEVATGLPESLDSYDIAINATPLGMDYAPGSAFSPELVATLPTGAFAADAITEPTVTQFLAAARACGLRTIDGRAMACGQFELLRAFVAPDD